VPEAPSAPFEPSLPFAPVVVPITLAAVACARACRALVSVAAKAGDISPAKNVAAATTPIVPKRENGRRNAAQRRLRAETSKRFTTLPPDGQCSRRRRARCAVGRKYTRFFLLRSFEFRSVVDAVTAPRGRAMCNGPHRTVVTSDSRRRVPGMMD